MGKKRQPPEADSINRIIARNIKKRREELNIKQEVLIEGLDVEIDGWKKNESGENAIPIYRLIKIMELLDCDFDYLIGNIKEHRREYTDIANETGLDEEACKNLINYDYSTQLSWFIANGLLDYVRDVSIIVLKKCRLQYTLDLFPKELRKIIISWNDSRKNVVSFPLSNDINSTDLYSIDMHDYRRLLCILYKQDKAILRVAIQCIKKSPYYLSDNKWNAEKDEDYGFVKSVLEDIIREPRFVEDDPFTIPSFDGDGSITIPSLNNDGNDTNLKEIYHFYYKQLDKEVLELITEITYRLGAFVYDLDFLRFVDVYDYRKNKNLTLLSKEFENRVFNDLKDRQGSPEDEKRETHTQI